MGKHFDKNKPISASRVGGLEKDIDWHNQRLWKKKKYKEQIQKNNKKKIFREYKKL